MECTACFTELSTTTGINCCNNHLLCFECFEIQVKCQIDVENVGKFADNNCNILCGFCNEPFKDKKVISSVSDELAEQFQKVKHDIAVTKAEAEYEKKQKTKEHESTILKHKQFICENILTLHCAFCNAAVFDFDGCFAITCSNCNHGMCGWCLADCGNNAHPHVKVCSQSLHPGSYHGTFDEFKRVHLKNRKEKVIRYLNSIYSDAEREEVFDLVKPDLIMMNINLVKFVDGETVTIKDKKNGEEQTFIDFNHLFIEEDQIQNVRDQNVRGQNVRDQNVRGQNVRDQNVRERDVEDDIGIIGEMYRAIEEAERFNRQYMNIYNIRNPNIEYITYKTSKFFY